MKIIGGDDALFAFHAALGAVEGVRKAEAADLGRYTIRYASLNAVHAECVRACTSFNLAVCQEPTVHEGMFAVRTTLIHGDGSSIEFDPMCLPMPREAQALGSATTYLRRYSLVSIFGIPVADDDGRAATVSAQVQPGRRTEAERMIREAIALMDRPIKDAFTLAFKEQFHSTLSDLPAAKHGEALAWTKEWVEEHREHDEGDEAWVAAAKGPDA
jgi:hypothetical protein